jgi:hypothetical protein
VRAHALSLSHTDAHGYDKACPGIHGYTEDSLHTKNPGMSWTQCAEISVSLPCLGPRAAVKLPVLDDSIPSGKIWRPPDAHENIPGIPGTLGSLAVLARITPKP